MCGLLSMLNWWFVVFVVMSCVIVFGVRWCVFVMCLIWYVVVVGVIFGLRLFVDVVMRLIGIGFDRLVLVLCNVVMCVFIWLGSDGFSGLKFELFELVVLYGIGVVVDSWF